ncbi:Uncharacterised protein [Chlamydia trachomatis]|nr:Uncharacterised protein [Chlamydia trachomatis]
MACELIDGRQQGIGGTQVSAHGVVEIVGKENLVGADFLDEFNDGCHVGLAHFTHSKGIVVVEGHRHFVNVLALDAHVLAPHHAFTHQDGSFYETHVWAIGFSRALVE